MLAQNGAPRVPSGGILSSSSGNSRSHCTSLRANASVSKLSRTAGRGLNSPTRMFPTRTPGCKPSMKKTSAW